MRRCASFASAVSLIKDFAELVIVRVTPVVEDMNAGKRRDVNSARTTGPGEVWIGTKDVLY
jgi:hypothetical protein